MRGRFAKDQRVQELSGGKDSQDAPKPADSKAAELRTRSDNRGSSSRGKCNRGRTGKGAPASSLRSPSVCMMCPSGTFAHNPGSSLRSCGNSRCTDTSATACSFRSRKMHMCHQETKQQAALMEPSRLKVILEQATRAQSASPQEPASVWRALQDLCSATVPQPTMTSQTPRTSPLEVMQELMSVSRALETFCSESPRLRQLRSKAPAAAPSLLAAHHPSCLAKHLATLEARMRQERRHEPA